MKETPAKSANPARAPFFLGAAGIVALLTFVAPLTESAGAPEAPPVAVVPVVRDRAVFKQGQLEFSVRPDTETKSRLDNHHLFRIEGTNGGKTGATIFARIKIFPKPVRGSTTRPALCLAYLEVPLGEERGRTITCRLSGALSHWELTITKVWSLIP